MNSVPPLRDQRGRFTAVDALAALPTPRRDSPLPTPALISDWANTKGRADAWRWYADVTLAKKWATQVLAGIDSYRHADELQDDLDLRADVARRLIAAGVDG